MAIHTAKYFVVDLDRTIQFPFVVFHGLKDHEDATVRKAQDYIEAHYQEKLHVETLADKFSITRRTFERRFKKATRHTVVEYIHRFKVEATKKQARNRNKVRE